MPRVPKLRLLIGLAAMIAVGTAGAVTAAAQGSTGQAIDVRSVSMTGTSTDCECEEVPSCPAPTPTTPTPTPSFSEPPQSPSPSPTLTASPGIRLAGNETRMVAAELKIVLDVDVTGFRNGQELLIPANDGTVPPQLKKRCPKDGKFKVTYTWNPFQGSLITIRFDEPGFFPDNCWVTIKVLDPATGRVTETYEQPSDLILTQQDYVGFKHTPARIRVEITCEE